MTECLNMNIQSLVSNAACYEKIRSIRWPEGILCPGCGGWNIIRRGKDDTQHDRQRYQCKSCHGRFDDLTDTVFEGHHQPLKVWILCLYFMGLNLSNQQIASELDLNPSDVQGMTQQLREGVEKKNFSFPVR